MNPYQTMMAGLSPKVIHKVLKIMDSIAIRNKGSGLMRPHGLLPMNVALNNGGAYEKGVCDALLLIYGEILKTPDGRKAIADLGFEPLFELAESQRKDVRND